MTGSSLSVVFLWHMHQPYYRDPFTGQYRLPWVRLHGTKDYLDMVAILSEFPDVKMTFNLVPSLIEQLVDYTDCGASDAFLDVTRKRAADLSEEDRVFLLENFFLANWETKIKPLPRYHELLSKRGFHTDRRDLHRIARYFTDSDFRDLQVLFNIVWIDPMHIRNDKALSVIAAKGAGYSEEEKGIVIEKQFEILRDILPVCRKLSDNGQIEISSSPFYHPILPLLWDTETARIATPDMKLPKRRFSYPRDAQQQVRQALAFHEKTFGRRPAGMWPSEGSVSPDVARMMRDEGLQWIATDEDVLAASLRSSLRASSGAPADPARLYSAYDFEGLSIIFRDHKLSDMIGFVYSGWDPKEAARDLIRKFTEIHDTLPDHESHIVPVILDGENAWEYYRNDGQDFLRYLYDGLSRHESIGTATVSGYLNQHPRRRRLESLHSGSWIYANFAVWIGHEEDNTAWDYLTEARAFFEAVEKNDPGKITDAARKSLYIAEGSDWNWWYGDEHSTENAREFDELFRMNLMKIYRDAGTEIPPHLLVPVLREDRASEPAVRIRGFINPRIDGIVTSYYEWYHAAQIEVGRSGGSMHMSESYLSKICYGFNKEYFFLRIDPKEDLLQLPGDVRFSVEIIKPHQYRIDIILAPEAAAELSVWRDGEWCRMKEISDVSAREVIEIGMSFRDIGAKENDDLLLFVSLRRDREEIERCPWRGYINFTVPSSDFEAMMWY